MTTEVLVLLAAAALLAVGVTVFQYLVRERHLRAIDRGRQALCGEGGREFLQSIDPRAEVEEVRASSSVGSDVKGIALLTLVIASAAALVLYGGDGGEGSEVVAGKAGSVDADQVSQGTLDQIESTQRLLTRELPPPNGVRVLKVRETAEYTAVGPGRLQRHNTLFVKTDPSTGELPYLFVRVGLVYDARSVDIRVHWLDDNGEENQLLEESTWPPESGEWAFHEDRDRIQVEGTDAFVAHLAVNVSEGAEFSIELTQTFAWDPEPGRLASVFVVPQDFGMQDSLGGFEATVHWPERVDLSSVRVFETQLLLSGERATSTWVPAGLSDFSVESTDDHRGLALKLPSGSKVGCVVYYAPPKLD